MKKQKETERQSYPNKGKRNERTTERQNEKNKKGKRRNNKTKNR